MSQAQETFDEVSLNNLAQAASQKNNRLCVTGYLCYYRGEFFQYLEGEEATVRELMAVISIDPRHRVVTTVELGVVQERLFPDWNMRYLSDNRLSQIQLDHVLHSVLSGMRSHVFGEAKLRENVLRIVGRIAQRRPQLA